MAHEFRIIGIGNALVAAETPSSTRANLLRMRTGNARLSQRRRDNCCHQRKSWLDRRPKMATPDALGQVVSGAYQDGLMGTVLATMCVFRPDLGGDSGRTWAVIPE